MTRPAAPLAAPDTFAAGPPWEFCSRLRAEETVAWTPEEAPHVGFWSVTRHRDIVAVSRDWQTFSSARGVSLEELDNDQLTHRTPLTDPAPPGHRPCCRLSPRRSGPRS